MSSHGFGRLAPLSAWPGETKLAMALLMGLLPTTHFRIIWHCKFIEIRKSRKCENIDRNGIDRSPNDDDDDEDRGKTNADDRRTKTDLRSTDVDFKSASAGC